MVEEKNDTITLSKNTIWKFATVILAVALVVVLVIMFKGNGGTGNVVDNGNNGNTDTQKVDMKVFEDNSALYPSLGPENAEVTVIEFSDFQCPFCAMASGKPAWTSQYQTQYGELINSAGKIEEMAAQGKLRLIYVSMSFLGQESVDAAQAGLCANDQGKFWEMHDKIFTAHDMKENNGKYTKDKLKVLAKGVSGLDQTKFANCLDNDEKLDDVQKISQAASGAGVSGTPTFIVNGQQVSASWSTLSAAIQ